MPFSGLDGILNALVDGTLIAFTVEHDAVIPASEWSGYLSASAGGAENSYYWGGRVALTHTGSANLVDKLPYVRLSDAAGWLRSKKPKAQVGRPRTVDEAVKVFLELYPKGREGVQWETVLDNVNARLETKVKLDSLQKAVNKYGKNKQ